MISDLIYQLRKQYRPGIHTCNPCVTKGCKGTVIGTGECCICLGRDLIAAGVPQDDVFSLHCALAKQRQAAEIVDKLVERIYNQAGDDAPE